MHIVSYLVAAIPLQQHLARQNGDNVDKLISYSNNVNDNDNNSNSYAM